MPRPSFGTTLLCRMGAGMFVTFGCIGVRGVDVASSLRSGLINQQRDEQE